MKRLTGVLVFLLAAFLAAAAAASESFWPCHGCGKKIPGLLGFQCPYCGAAHSHVWQDATCTAPETCAECGETEGESLGHDWQDATCTAPKTCARCGLTEGRALGHDWRDATCTTPKTCARCALTEGEPLGHSWGNETVLKAATCAEPGEASYTCAVCGETKTEVIPVDPDHHTGAEKPEPPLEPTCTEAGYLGAVYCADCGALLREREARPAPGHDWRDATCTTPKTCARCGLTEGEPLGHSWRVKTVLRAATCVKTGEAAYICDLCGETKTDALPLDPDRHTGLKTVEKPLEPTCTEAGYLGAVSCADCGAVLEARVEQPARGHEWQDATCTAPKTCARCGLTEGEAAGHSWLPEDDKAPGTCAACGALLGDVDSNGEVNTGDILLMAVYINLRNAAKMDLARADLNADGEVNLRDYQLLERFVNTRKR